MALYTLTRHFHKLFSLLDGKAPELPSSPLDLDLRLRMAKIPAGLGTRGYPTGANMEEKFGFSSKALKSQRVQFGDGG